LSQARISVTVVGEHHLGLSDVLFSPSLTDPDPSDSEHLLTTSWMQTNFGRNRDPPKYLADFRCTVSAQLAL